MSKFGDMLIRGLKEIVNHLEKGGKPEEITKTRTWRQLYTGKFEVTETNPGQEPKVTIVTFEELSKLLEEDDA